ncbi:hypothetical protein MRB53_038127 [Persea americana]|nr:hypothetical protein MRB53_038127 [Persea americana]
MNLRLWHNRSSSATATSVPRIITAVSQQHHRPMLDHDKDRAEAFSSKFTLVLLRAHLTSVNPLLCNPAIFATDNIDNHVVRRRDAGSPPLRASSRVRCGRRLSTLHILSTCDRLWGNPVHLNHIAKSLRAAFSEDTLHILLAKRNVGSFTYDGIEKGGERVTQEIEDELESLEKDGKKIEKLSMVGYSLGGLVARYSVGLLYSKGIFDKIAPVNFTTFASPHIGVRSPLGGWHNHVWNVMGARTLSASGTQLFTVDKFRDTGRPLLSILADPDSIFIRGLRSFKHKSLYANIVNDRAVPYYTAYFSRHNPYHDLSKININYVPGYENVIIDSKNPVALKPKALPADHPPQTAIEAAATSARAVLTRAPIYLLLGVFIPLGSIAYLLNAGFQSFRSAQRIRLHDEGKVGAFSAYRLPLLLTEARRRAEGAYEAVNNDSTHEDYLDSDAASPSAEEVARSPWSDEKATEPVDVRPEEGKDGVWPTLALTPAQFAMIDSLDKVGFAKHAVHIQRATHSHAAIIVRTPRQAFADGKVVSRHWLERFEV